MKTTETDKDSRRKLLEKPEVQDIMVSLLKYRSLTLNFKKSFVEEFVAHELSKLNDPTITTHDGVIVKPGQWWWTIIWTSSGPIIVQLELFLSKDRTWFSTEAAAEAYLEMLFEGYLADKDYYSGGVKKGDVFHVKDNFYVNIKDKTLDYPLPAEIVTTWEKKYRKP